MLGLPLVQGHPGWHVLWPCLFGATLSWNPTLSGASAMFRGEVCSSDRSLTLLMDARAISASVLLANWLMRSRWECP